MISTSVNIWFPLEWVVFHAACCVIHPGTSPSAHITLKGSVRTICTQARRRRRVEGLVNKELKTPRLRSPSPVECSGKRAWRFACGNPSCITRAGRSIYSVSEGGPTNACSLDSCFLMRAESARRTSASTLSSRHPLRESGLSSHSFNF